MQNITLLDPNTVKINFKIYVGGINHTETVPIALGKLPVLVS